MLICIQHLTYMDQQFTAFYSLFLLYIQVESYRNVLNLGCSSLAFTSFKAFFKKKTKRGLGPSLAVSFSA